MPYNRPVANIREVARAIILRTDGSVLLARRASSTEYGKLDLPGGRKESQTKIFMQLVSGKWKKRQG